MIREAISMTVDAVSLTIFIAMVLTWVGTFTGAF